MTLDYTTTKTPIGILYIIADDNHLISCTWNKPKIEHYETRLQPKNKILQLTIKELNLYFEQKLQRFSVPIDFSKLEGTDFQKKIWKNLKTISYGKTASYKDMAIKVDNPKGFRAVGNANGKNPITIILPCHRVIQSNGELGGYTGPKKVKPYLLKLETGLNK